MTNNLERDRQRKRVTDWIASWPEWEQTAAQVILARNLTKPAARQKEAACWDGRLCWGCRSVALSPGMTHCSACSAAQHKETNDG